jgi:hypothetical protein
MCVNLYLEVLTISPAGEALESGVGNEEVSTVGAGVHAVDHNVLVFLVNVSLLVALDHHLGMEMVENALDAADTLLVVGTSDTVQARVRDEVEELGVEVVKALVGTESRLGERHESTGGKSVLSSTLISGRLVVVRHIVEHCVRS